MGFKDTLTKFVISGMWACHSVLVLMFIYGSKPGVPKWWDILTFQGVLYYQNLNCKRDALTPYCGDSETKSCLKCGENLFFGLQARFSVDRASCFLQNNTWEFWWCTSEFTNGQRVPMNSKFGTPWSKTSTFASL